MLNWSSRFNIFCFLEHAGEKFEVPAFDYLLAAGSVAHSAPEGENLFRELEKFHRENPGWLFGHLAYPQTPGMRVTRTGRIPYEQSFFFSPSVIVKLKGNHVYIESSVADGPEEIFSAIDRESPVVLKHKLTRADMRNDMTKAAYLSAIETLKKHILRGDCYEINFCMEYVAENAELDPCYTYQRLRTESPNPFSAFYRLNNRYCLCASPERFIRKQGNTVISQPIKGTAKRYHGDPVADERSWRSLAESSKERAENVMVVDLVRNDLSRVAEEGSVTVPELCGIYAFPQVFQMISTVQARVAADLHWTSILEACFPMGSMTGAPKRKVMELIDRYEPQPRGLFSGTIGYVTPEGDMDFNVVIRSLFYDESTGMLTCKAGSGITAYCQAEAEYEECELKAAAIRKILADG